MRGNGQPPYGADRGGQPPRDLYQAPRPPQPRQSQPPQQPWSAGDAYGRRDDDGYGDDGYGAGGRYGNGRGRPVDAYPSRDRYGDADEDAWTPRARGSRDQARGGDRRAAAASGSVGLRPGAAHSGRIGDGNVNEDIDLDEIDPSGHARRAASMPGGKKPQTRKRKIIKWTAIGVSSALVLILAIGAYVILHLTGNIKHTALLQSGVSQAPEPVDKYGRSPLNILVIGSDTRSSAANCKIGGRCGPGANADVEMVVHLSADRSNATVMSIPRDTIVMLPHCTDPATHVSGGGFTSTINSSLQWGPSCTVTTVHQLTGLTIDHFVMVDFVGVETMSNALGGVQVCVTDSMYDPDSHLRLHKGQNKVQGASALAFVRSRHGFYDGSDLGREKAQHYFLSGMIRQVRATMNLTEFTTLYKVADAATKALTVDDGLSGVTGIEGLAVTMNRVPTNRISFVTMPWDLDPHNQAHVVPAQPYADQMFRNIGNDVAYSAGSSTASKSAAPQTSAKPSTEAPQAVVSPTVAVNKAAVHLQVFNGSGASGRASTVRDALVNDGFSLTTVAGNASAAKNTKIYYPSTRADSAATVAYTLGLPSSALVESNAYSQVTLVIGADWTSGTTFGAAAGPASGTGGSANTTPTAAASAPAVSSLLNAATTGGCVSVNPHYATH